MLPIRSLFPCVLFLPLLLVLPAIAQQSTPARTPPARRDPQAVSDMREALQTMGGSAAWTQVQDVTESGSCTDNLSQDAAASQFTWTVQGDNFRYQNSGSDGRQYVLASGHGKPARSDGNTTKPLSLRTASLTLPYQLPGLVLAKAWNDPSYSLRYVGNATWNQAPAIQIEIARTILGYPQPETTQTWYLNPQTMQPMAVTFFLPGEQDADHYAQPTYSYSQYQTVSGLSIPENFVFGFVGTGYRQQCTTQQVRFNTEPSDNSFDLPLSDGGQN